MLNEVLMSLQFAMNQRRAKSSRASTRFLHRIKDNLAPAIRYITRFRETAIATAKSKAFDGIMCGHIHFPQNIFSDNIHYLNTGDWVENCSAIVELMNGQLYLIENTNLPREASTQATALSPTLIGRFPVITKQSPNA